MVCVVIFACLQNPVSLRTTCSSITIVIVFDQILKYLRFALIKMAITVEALTVQCTNEVLCNYFCLRGVRFFAGFTDGLALVSTIDCVYTGAAIEALTAKASFLPLRDSRG